MSSSLHFYFNGSSLLCNQLAKLVHCNGRHCQVVLHITIIAYRHTSHVGYSIDVSIVKYTLLT